MASKSFPPPLAHVKSITKTDVGNFDVVVQCCYCFKEHVHGPGVDLSTEVPDDLGHRVEGCYPLRFDLVGYRLSTVAWKISGKSIVTASKGQKKSDK